MLSKIHKKIAMKVGIFILAAIIIVLMMPQEKQLAFEYQIGTPWMNDNLIAQKSFAILKSDAMLNANQAAVIDAQTFYFNEDTVVIALGLELIKQHLTEELSAINTRPEIIKQYILQAHRAYSSIMLKGIIEEIPNLADKPEHNIVIIQPDNRIYNKPVNSFYTKKQAVDAINEFFEANNIIATHYLKPVIINQIQCNIIYNKEFTDMALQQQLNDISTTSGVIQAGELIIGKGSIVTEEKGRVLDSYLKSFSNGSEATINTFGQIAGRSIIAILSLLILALNLYLFKKDIFWSNRNIALILSVILLLLLCMTITVRFGDEYIYAVPICLAPLLITTFFGARPALYTHIVLLLNTGFIVSKGLEFIFIQMLAGIITIFSIIKLQKRAQVLKMMLLVFLTYIVSTIGFSLVKTGNFQLTNSDMLVYFAISSASLIISYPITILFERIFGIITNVTLMELSDTNNKLLRELSTKAPGTFQHANQVANLAEEAAYIIDADPMLVRAGAWYHDIGKIENPSFFIENQIGNQNSHTNLSYTESAQTIINHITNGITLAKKHHLPRQVTDFIKTHHGNRQTFYFYNMAKKGNNEVDPAPFTYPGPIPYSKETALVMMADVVEATSRSLNNPNEESIKNMVEKAINDLIAEHQLDNANITMRHINIVKQLFTKRLLNIYHVRIAYPESIKKKTHRNSEKLIS